MRFLACSILLAAAGCGNGGLSTNTSPDVAVPLDLAMVPPDLTAIPDLTPPPPDLSHRVIDAAGLQCGNKTCGKGMLCCGTFVPDGGMLPSFACAASCPDGGVPLTCDGPEDCPQATPFCCANFSVDNGQAPFCPILAATAKCAKSCDLVIPMACPGSGQAKFCHQGADCAGGGGGDKNCCEYMGISACLPDLVKMFVQCVP